jgi:hypothetical protein
VGVLVGVALLALRADGDERQGARAPAAIGALALGLPLALAPTRFDYFYAPNVIAALPPLAIALAVGFAARRARPIGVWVAAALCLLSAALVVRVALEPSLQRRDWRSAARQIGAATVDRAIVVPDHGDHPLLVYLSNTTRMPPGGALVREIDAASVRNAGGARPPRSPALLRELARFGPISERTGERFSVLRAPSERPHRILRSSFAGTKIDGVPVEVLLQRAGRIPAG